MTQFFQIAGALLVLAAFGASQAGWLDGKSLTYLVLNVVGAGILAVVALVDRDWGFLLLEGAWTIVSAVSLVQLQRTTQRHVPPVS